MKDEKIAAHGEAQCCATSTEGRRCDYYLGHQGNHYNAEAELTFETDILPGGAVLKVTEMFYSLQGEGARAGEPSIFIRLQGCSAKHACAASGVKCDTEFESGAGITVDELIEKCIHINPGHVIPGWIVWTGGEPLDQLTSGILKIFKDKGFKQAIETSGVRYMREDVSNQLDHVTVSPKVAEHIVEKHFGHLRRSTYGYTTCVDELRYVRHAGQPGVPQPRISARFQYLSPHGDGAEINSQNLKHCIRLCLENPMWRLSVQQHKLWRVL